MLCLQIKQATEYILSTLMGTTWSKMIYIYLLLYNTRVHRDEWIYITSKWSSLLLCYAFNMISLVHVALAALFQCHLHFPCIHYQAVAVCFAFILQVAPHMKITHIIFPGKILHLSFAPLTIDCTVTSWLPLCFMCEITAPWDCR